MRATMSELDPGVNGTTKRIGRSGQLVGCAEAVNGVKISSNATPSFAKQNASS
jgi:hypothetical protein